ncbi:hypothetical protein MBLNU459_g4728t1 [Dothideomycetes sp. NU459]
MPNKIKAKASNALKRVKKRSLEIVADTILKILPDEKQPEVVSPLIDDDGTAPRDQLDDTAREQHAGQVAEQHDEQHDEQTEEQTDEQHNEQANEQHDEQTNEQHARQANEEQVSQSLQGILKEGTSRWAKIKKNLTGDKTAEPPKKTVRFDPSIGPISDEEENAPRKKWTKMEDGTRKMLPVPLDD